MLRSRSPRSARTGALIAGMMAGAVAVTVAAGSSGGLSAAAPDEDGPTYSHEAVPTGVEFGFQIGIDDVNRLIYVADARNSREGWTWDSTANDGAGEFTGVEQIAEAGAKISVIDIETRQRLDDHDYSELTRNTGDGNERGGWENPPSFDDPPCELAEGETTCVAETGNWNRTSFAPYGIAIDPHTPDGPTIITTNARSNDEELGYGGNIVIYNANDGGPTDDDRLWAFDDGEPILGGSRRLAVNSETHRAYITNMGAAHGRGGPTDGFIAEIDLVTKQPTARIAIPQEELAEGPTAVGAIGVAVDAANDLIYVGTLRGTGLYVIDGSALDRSDAQDLTLNADAITRLPANVGANARPTYNAELQRLYVSSYPSFGGTGHITVVDADPTSDAYGTVIDTITGAEGSEYVSEEYPAELAAMPTNSVEVDGERGLVYSANLGDQEVVVYDAETHAELLRLPTSGHAINLAIDPATGDVWVGNWGNTAQVVDVFTITEG